MQNECNWHLWAKWIKILPKTKKKRFCPRQDSNPGRLGEPLSDPLNICCFLLITFEKNSPHRLWIHFCNRTNVLVKMIPLDVQKWIPNCQKAVFHILTSLFSKRARGIFLFLVPFNYPYIGLGWSDNHCPGSFFHLTRYG